MESEHRDRIQRYHVKLSQTVDIDTLYPVLLEKGAVIQGDLERLKAKHVLREDQAQEFFLRYTKRGPKAFQNLIDALIETGHISEARLLENGSIYDGSFRRSSSGGMEKPLSVVSMMSPRSLSNPPSVNASPKLSLRSVPETRMDEMAPINLEVMNAQIYNNGVSLDECYQMMSHPRGFALIINNIEFPGDVSATRHGAAKDSENLEKVLKLLHFEVTVRHNVQKTALLKEGGIIDSFLSQFASNDVDCCVVAVMSHGTEGYFQTSDTERSDPHWNRVSLWKEFLPRFNNNYRPLQNKPKVFIIQACRGDTRDRGVQRTLADSKDPERSGGSGSEESSPNLSYRSKSSTSSSSDLDRMPSYEDFLICQSTVPGFVANRDIEKGTWYIYSLCQLLCERAHDTELTSILRMVGRRMRSISSEYGDKQMSSFINAGFHHYLYFNPGLFGDLAN